MSQSQHLEIDQILEYAILAGFAYLDEDNDSDSHRELNWLRRSTVDIKDARYSTFVRNCQRNCPDNIRNCPNNIRNCSDRNFQRNQRELVVAIRGTTNLTNFVANIDQRPRVVDDHLVHNGYFQHYKLIESSLFDDVSDFLRGGDLRNGDLRNGDLRNGDLKNGDLKNGDLRNGVQVTLVGHSLGGAVATIASTFLRDLYSSRHSSGHSSRHGGKINVVTFGTPPFANRSFCDNDNSLRVVDTNDIVPKISVGFRHHSRNSFSFTGRQRDPSLSHGIKSYVDNLSLLESGSAKPVESGSAKKIMRNIKIIDSGRNIKRPFFGVKF